ncbi:MAG TPA: hypothetical protein VNO81_13625 [Candidatus Nitrosotenuis sp.]|jgi:predicted amino acid-binding ACT domain protein|nr:hypothetical protein [Candidatus Nitrosotenuis sp.]
MPAESGCRLIVAAFSDQTVCIPSGASYELVLGEARLQAQSPQHASMAAQIYGLLARRGLQVLRMEQVSDGGCAALLVHAQAQACESQDLLALRQDLQAAGRELGYTLRVQREELFRYMHRI